MNLRSLFRRRVQAIDIPGWPRTLPEDVLAIRFPASEYAGPPPLGFREVFNSPDGRRHFERVRPAVIAHRVGLPKELRKMAWDEWRETSAKVIAEAAR